MSFLSKNWAGLLVCLIISIISWVLGGFLPVVEHLFSPFYRNDSLPLSHSYKQLDAGLTYSSKNCFSMLLSYLVLDSISLKFSQLENLPFPVILSTISIALIIAFFFQRFFNMGYKASYLDWGRLFYLWRFCHCSDCSCYSRQGKRSSPSHFCYLFSSMSWQLLSFQL